MRRSLLSTLAAAAFAAGVAVPAAAQGAPEARPLAVALADLRLATAARLALVDDPRTRALDVETAARSGVVAVSGVEDVAMQATAAAVVLALPGVRSVQGLGAAGASGDAAASPAVPIREAPRTHTVRRGDTLYGIARRYGTTVGALTALNRLRSTSIRVGQRLRVR